VFEPTVIEDYKRRLSGVDSVLPEDLDDSTTALQSQPREDQSLTPSAPSPSTVEPVGTSQAHEEEEPEKKSFGGFKMSFKAASFAPAVPSKSKTALVARPEEEEQDVELDGAPIGSGGRQVENVDVDGAEIDVDGAEIDVDAAEVDVDGAEVDVDGAEIDVDGDEVVDVDGAPVGEPEEAAMEMDSDDPGKDGDDIFK